ncbi:MAG TPA: lamin tail domain-containing protein, partial [Bacillota bacterium]|nr:lamin tail domain-containing protein [Bacillota bacterium]
MANPVGPSPALRFNEVMAENAGAVTNGGTLPDWVELYNPGTNAVFLANWSLSNSGNPRKYVFPSGTTIAGQSYLVVWCDSQTGAPGLHSGFNLGRKGESLFLYDAATNRVDAFTFGVQLANYTVGRVGPAATWQLCLPTPGSNNLAAAVGGATNLVINEWLANPAAGGSDWLELYNLSPNQPVALAGLYLATGNDLFQMRSVSFLGPRSFVQLFADKNPGPDHLDFKLSASGDQLALSDALGQPLDQVTFGPQLEGVSQGRWPNGSSTIISFAGTASPGASNYVI